MKDDRPVVIVTGASSGIGAASALCLARVGAKVALVARSKTALAKVADKVAEKGGQSIVLALDVSDPKACQQAVNKTLDHFGRINGLINTAGTVEPLGAVARVDPFEWRQNLSVNLLGPFYFCRSALPALRKQRGRIVNYDDPDIMGPARNLFI